MLDFMLPGWTGNELLNAIRSVLPKTKIFIFTAHEQSAHLIPKSCIEGFFLNSDGIENLIMAINHSLGVAGKKG